MTDEDRLRLLASIDLVPRASEAYLGFAKLRELEREGLVVLMLTPRGAKALAELRTG